MYKTSLKQWAMDKIYQRARQAERSGKNAQDAANNEEKSSAGDKYETARSMAQLETNMHNMMLAGIRKEISQLQALDISRIYDSVVPGSFVRCDEFSFFITAGLGKHLINGSTIIFMSPDAPLLKEILHKKANDTFTFQGRQNKILEVF